MSLRSTVSCRSLRDCLLSLPPTPLPRCSTSTDWHLATWHVAVVTLPLLTSSNDWPISAHYLIPVSNATPRGRPCTADLTMACLCRRFDDVVDSVRPSVVRCPPRCHISKIKQARPIFTIEHYLEVGTIDSVATFKSFPDAPLGRYSVFQYKLCANVNTAFCSTWRQATAVVNTRIFPPVLSTINGVRRWQLLHIYNHRSLYWRRQSHSKWASFYSDGRRMDDGRKQRQQPSHSWPLACQQKFSIYNKLRCRRQAVRLSMLLKILLSYSWSWEITRL